MALFVICFALVMSFEAVWSVFESSEETIARIRAAAPWRFRLAQLFCLFSLLVVQALLFGKFGTAPFSGLSLLLYLVIIWEVVWMALFWSDWAAGFLAANPLIAGPMKLFAAGQGVFLITLIVGWFGFGPAASEFTTGATAQKAVADKVAASAGNFVAHWRRTVKASNGSSEEEIDAHVSGKDFTVVKKRPNYQNASVYSGGQMTEVSHILAGAGLRKAEPGDATPADLRRKMFWLPTEGLKEAPDQSNAPGARPMTLFLRESSPGSSLVFKEWVDREAKIVLYREESVGETGEWLESTGVEIGAAQAAAFNPDNY